MIDPDRQIGRAIVLFSRSWQALSCIRSLGLRGVDVIAADEFSITPGSLSKYSSDSFQYTNPMQDEQQFLDDLSQAIDRYTPGSNIPYVLIPTQRETRLIAQHADRFEGRIKIAAPAIELIEKVCDKGWLANYADEQGVPIPNTWCPANVAELKSQLSDAEFPVIVKIRSGIGGIGLRLCETLEQAADAYTEFCDQHALTTEAAPIVQQAVPGDDYCVCAIADNGVAKGVTTYMNVGKLSGGGPGMVRETVSAPGAELATKKLLKSLGWHGVAQLDFVWSGDEQDPAYLIELNARLFSGLFQIVASGVDYPWYLFQLASGKKIPDSIEPEIGVRTETPVLGLLSTLKDVAEEFNPGSRLETAWSAASQAWQKGHYVDATRLWLAELSESDSLEDRVERVAHLLEQREQNICELFDGEDPQATLGLLYPLVAYLKYGKISQDVLTGLKAP